jgi:hypothetical protein
LAKQISKVETQEKGRHRRASGEGSIYQRASDNRWVGSAYVYTATGQRKRRPVYDASFDEVRQKLDRLKGDSANGVLGAGPEHMPARLS